MLTPEELDNLSPASEAEARAIEADMLAEMAAALGDGVESGPDAASVSAAVRAVAKRHAKRLHEALWRDVWAAMSVSGSRDAEDAEEAAGGFSWLL